MNEENENINLESGEEIIDFDKIFDSFELESWGGENIDMIKIAKEVAYCSGGYTDGPTVDCSK